MFGKIDVVRRLFDAVERRDLETVLDCYDADVEIVEAASLPYGGTYRGHEGARRHAAGFVSIWGPLQTPAEHRLDAEFCDGPGDTVVALFRHRAFNPITDERFDEPELSVYEVRDGKVVRSQMFHADSLSVAGFARRCHTSLVGLVGTTAPPRPAA
jgi:ketosteroid isomerase-like protein